MVCFSFGSFCRGTVTLAATVMLMKATCGWTVQSGSFDRTTFDTVLLGWCYYVDQEQQLPLWTAVPAGTVSPLVTIDDVLCSFVSLLSLRLTFIAFYVLSSSSARIDGPVSN